MLIPEEEDDDMAMKSKGGKSAKMPMHKMGGHMMSDSAMKKNMAKMPMKSGKKK